MSSHDLQVTLVPLEELSQHPQNANMGDVDAIEESVVVNGFYSPIIVQRSTGHILAGNHRYMVAAKMGLPALPVIYLDVDDEAALRIMVADNRTTRLGRDDESQLLEVLELLRGTDAGFSGTGYEYRDFAALIELMEAPLELMEPEPLPEVEGPERGKGLIYLVEPIVEDDGVVYSFTVFKPGSKRLSAADLNAVRTAFGQNKLTKEQIADLGVGSWTPR